MSLIRGPRRVKSALDVNQKLEEMRAEVTERRLRDEQERIKFVERAKVWYFLTLMPMNTSRFII